MIWENILIRFGALVSVTGLGLVVGVLMYPRNLLNKSPSLTSATTWAIAFVSTFVGVVTFPRGELVSLLFLVAHVPTTAGTFWIVTSYVNRSPRSTLSKICPVQL